MCNQDDRKFLVPRKRKVRDGDGVRSLFSQEFKQFGAFEIADLGSYNPILLNLGRSAVELSIEGRKYKLMMIELM